MRFERNGDQYLSDAFLDRVRRSYKVAVANSNDHRGRMWGEIDQRRAAVHAALLADTNDQLRTIFTDPAGSDLFIGIDYLRRNVLQWTLPPHAFVAGSTIGSTGIREHLERAAERLFDLLPTRLKGMPFPNPFPDEVGLQTEKGVASYRAIQTLYQASIIEEALKACTIKSVLEIGPGMGRTAFYARQLGITDYTTIDLPIGTVAQACFLGATLGPDAILLPGEEFQPAGRIKMLVAGQKPDRKYGVAFNADSMTEMSLPAAMDYVGWLHQHCESFVSANRTDNLFKVADISLKWFTISDRRPYPVEPGYVEEIFTPRRSAGLTAWHRIGYHQLKLVGKRGPKRAVKSIYNRARAFLGG